MIALWGRTAQGIEPLGEAPTAESALRELKRLNAQKVTAVSFDGSTPKSATGYTSERDLGEITAAVAGSSARRDGATLAPGGIVLDRCPCTWPGCTGASRGYKPKLPVHLRPFCQTHRMSIGQARGVDQADPDSVAAFVAQHGAEAPRCTSPKGCTRPGTRPSGMCGYHDNGQRWAEDAAGRGERRSRANKPVGVKKPARASRAAIVQRCKNCGTTGHNARTCGR